MVPRTPYPAPIDVGSLVLGRYDVVERLGAGGFGIVWRGRDRLLDRDVALKHVPVARPDDDAETREARRRRTLREGRALARLGHARVVTIHDMVEDPDGAVWLVLEYVRGRSLDDLLAADGGWSPARVARLGTALAAALAHGHARGLVHRDVKPANILVGEDEDGDGLVKLADYGIARLLDQEQLTGSQQRFGSAAWASPEWARGDEVTAASDVFSLGATLFHAVEGRPPFGRGEGEPLGGLLMAVAAARAVTPRRAGPLGAVLTAMLAGDPAGRPTAVEAGRMLALAAAEAEVTSDHAADGPTDAPPPQDGPTAPVRPRSSWSPVRRVDRSRRARRSVPLAVAATMVVAVLAGALWAASERAAVVDDPSTMPSTGVAPVVLAGDERDADPCGLVDPAALAGFGAASPTPGPYFTACTLRLRSPGSTADVRLVVDLFRGGAGDSTGVRTAIGTGTLVREGGTPEACRATVALVDDRSVTLRTRSDDTRVDACRLLDTATALVVRALDARGFPTRAGRTTGWPLATADACALATRAALAPVGLDAQFDAGHSGWGRWDCRWGREVQGTPQVQMNLRLEDDTDVLGRGPISLVAGRTLVTETDEGDANPRRCTTALLWRPVTDPAGHFQVLESRVEGPRDEATLCATARGLVTTAADLLDRR